MRGKDFSYTNQYYLYTEKTKAKKLQSLAR